jgi:hypothetical protein
MFYVQGPSEAWYPTYGLLKIKENVQIVSLDFGIAEDKTSGALLSFTMISYERSFQSHCKTWIYRLRFSYGSGMIMLHIFFLQFGNF